MASKLGLILPATSCTNLCALYNFVTRRLPVLMTSTENTVSTPFRALEAQYLIASAP
ncbi:hypothetical protein ANAPC5_00941 [Anaplasma phagocytophilum]|nr:hypothetical protein ANAPC3_00912 [Anaplasma phagocytophilum]SCV64699.1 hypothetical protein ANAPC5_00941 [Anaplasma phagocytophilum]